MKKILTICTLILSICFTKRVYCLTHDGDLTLTSQAEVNAFNYDVVTGTLTINGTGITNIDALNNLDTVGNLYVQNTNIVNVNGLNNLKAISGVNSGVLHSDLYFQNNPLLNDLSGFTNTVFIGNMVLVFYNCAALTNLEGLQDLDWSTVNKDIGIRDCNSLISLNGLELSNNIPPDDNHLSSLTILNNSNLIDVSAIAGFSVRDLTIDNNDKLPIIDLSSAPDWRVYSKISIQNNQLLKNIKFAKNAATELNILNNAVLDSIRGMKQIIAIIDPSDFIFGNITLGLNSNLKYIDLFNFIHSCKGGSANQLSIYSNPNITDLNFLSKFSYFGRITIENNRLLTNCCGIYNLIKDRPNSDSIGIIGSPFACRNAIDILATCGDTSNLTYNLIYGRIYSDINANNKPDMSDIFVDNIKIQATKNGNSIAHISTDTGRYHFVNDTGTYIIQPISSFANFATIPVVQTISHSTYGNRDTINFKIAPTALVNDASIVLINNELTRPNRQGSYTISYTNESGQNYNGTIKLKLDSRLSYQSAIPAPASIVGDTMIWNIANLPLFSIRKITINFIASASLVANDTLKSFAKIYNTQTDVTPLNNQYSLIDIIRSSFDPNDKVVNRTILSPTEAAQSPYLLYTIRFQNIGNDTAFDISITDTLDANLDWTTFQPITASHHYQLTQTNGRYIQFNFQNIKLPDSTINEVASHGFITYKIKTKNNLVIGNSISNRASIVFDVNAPVVTNTTKTVIMQTYAGRDTTICPKENITLTASGATSYVWNTGATTPNITVSPTITTTYIVTGIVNGISQKDTVVVNVKPLSVNLGNDITLCTTSPTVTLTATGNAISWLWNTGETTKSITKNAISATYAVLARLDNCVLTDTILVNIVNSTAKINPTLPSVCLNDSIQLNASGATNYAWSTGQTTSSIIVKPVIDSMIKLEGWNTYSKLEGGYDFAVVDYVDNIQHLLESWGIDANTTVTPNINFNTLQELATYMNSVEPQGNWYVSGQKILAQNPNIKYRNGNGLEYFVMSPSPASYIVRCNDKTLQNQKCASRDSVIVDVKPLPDVSFTKVVNGTSVQFNAPSGNSSYSWSFGDATPNSTAQNPLHNYTSNGKYYITLTSVLNGCTAQKTDSVSIIATAINNNISFVKSIDIYPNPSNEFVTLQLNTKKSTDFSVSLITIDGKVLIAKNYTATSSINEVLDLKNYSKGVYLLQIKSEQEQATYQIVKQ